MKDSNCFNDETLASYLEGKLHETVRIAAEEHLVECESCRSRLAGLMRILDARVRGDEHAVVDRAIARHEVRHLGHPLYTARDVTAGSRTAYGVILAVAAVLVGGVGAVFFWLSGPSTTDVLESILAERPYRARMSQQDAYAPFSGVRAPQDDVGDAALESMMVDATAFEQASYYIAVGDFEAGVDLMERVVVAAPAPAAWNNLGLAYMEMDESVAGEGNFQAARREFERAIAADPAFAVPLFNMAILLAREGMDEEAREYAARYAELDPDSEWTMELRELEVLSP